MSAELLITVLTLAINVFFVMAEIALFTTKKAKLYSMIRRNVFGAKNALHIVQKPDIFLSTVQIGLTITSLLLGWFGGISISSYMIKLFEKISYLREYSVFCGNISSIVIIAYFAILIEVVPKRVTMLYPERILLYVAYAMKFCILIAYPFALFLTASTRFCLKILKINKKDNDHTSIDEILFVVNQACHSGILHQIESGMVKRALTLSDMQAGAIMTPRSKIIMLNLQKKNVYNIRLICNNNFTYFPVVKDNLDNFIGIVSAKVIHKHRELSNEILEEIAIKSQVLYVPESTKLTKLIELFKIKKTKFSIVVDEYGEIEGIVTFSDIIQAFLGDVADIIDKGVRSIIDKKDDGSYIVDGNILIEEIKELLSIEILPAEEEEEYRTLASFLIKYLDNIPKIGEKVECCSWQFTIIKMDGNRIDKVYIIPIPDDKKDENIH